MAHMDLITDDIIGFLWFSSSYESAPYRHTFNIIRCFIIGIYYVSACFSYCRSGIITHTYKGKDKFTKIVFLQLLYIAITLLIKKNYTFITKSCCYWIIIPGVTLYITNILNLKKKNNASILLIIKN